MSYVLPNAADFILVYILDRSTELANIQVPYARERERVDLARDGWISYRVRDWLGVPTLSATERREFLDALVAHERAGLLEVFRDSTKRPTYLRLTAAGTEVARELIEQHGIEITAPQTESEAETTTPSPSGRPESEADSIAWLVSELEAVKEQLAEADERLIVLEADAMDCRDYRTAHATKI